MDSIGHSKLLLLIQLIPINELNEDLVCKVNGPENYKAAGLSIKTSWLVLDELNKSARG